MLKIKRYRRLLKYHSAKYYFKKALLELLIFISNTCKSIFNFVNYMKIVIVKDNAHVVYFLFYMHIYQKERKKRKEGRKCRQS